MIKAALDFGTNTLRLLVRDTEKNSTILRKNYYLLLGKECVDGHLSKAGIEKLRKALLEIKSVLQKLGVSEVFGVATAFARSLKNTDELFNSIKELVNCDVKLIDGKTEGLIVALAVKEYFGVNDDLLIIDIGGGSTEFIVEQAGSTNVISINVGSLYLTQKFFGSYPPSHKEVEDLVDFVKQNLPQEKFTFQNIFGVGGSITTLAFLLSGEKEYNPAKINGFIINRDDVTDFYNRIKGMSHKDMLLQYPIEAGREKVLLAGILEIMAIMDVFEINQIKSSDVSLIDGVFAYFKKSSFSN